MKILTSLNFKTLFWPDVCPFCGKAGRGGVCQECRKKADALAVREPRCMKCGKPVRYEEQEYCYDCQHTRHAYDRGVSLWLHKPPVSTSIYQFKYHNQRFYAGYYAKEAAGYATLLRRWAPEALVPIPLHPARRRKRGYNQSEVLAKELGEIFAIPVAYGAVKRVRNTRPQKVLGHDARRKNLEGAFAAASWTGRLKSVLLVDDIYTTGSTIDAAARVLKRAGVQKVYFLTISIGQG